MDGEPHGQHLQPAGEGSNIRRGVGASHPGVGWAPPSWPRTHLRETSNLNTCQMTPTWQRRLVL